MSGYCADSVCSTTGGFKSADHQNDARVQEVAAFAVEQVSPAVTAT